MTGNLLLKDFHHGRAGEIIAPHERMAEGVVLGHLKYLASEIAYVEQLGAVRLQLQRPFRGFSRHRLEQVLVAEVVSLGHEVLKMVIDAIAGVVIAANYLDAAARHHG